MRMTLRMWQNTLKPLHDLLYNCSEQSGADEWVDFPIGMGLRFIEYPRPLRTAQIGSHTKLVLCCVNEKTDLLRRQPPFCRRSYLETLAIAGIKNHCVDPEIYFSTLPNVKFLISPEGNGIDCHRTYEALLAGAIPIVEDHPGIRAKYEGCPVLFTKDYSEITEEYLRNIYMQWLDRSWDFSKLFLHSYSKEQQEQIKSNGNYWSEKVCKRRFY